MIVTTDTARSMKQNRDLGLSKTFMIDEKC